MALCDVCWVRESLVRVGIRANLREHVIDEHGIDDAEADRFVTVFGERRPERAAGGCRCDDPVVDRTFAKGTPAATDVCRCGGIITIE